ncbi:MAG TPA: hypothetical protein VFL91_11840 [Thermomicrobiales bacterium]|nr:hypothetical protein [Thermomicrobiales bacterium]
MKRVDADEFRGRTSRHLASGEAIAIERHGTLIGYSIPIRKVDEEAARRALARLREAVDRALAESGMTEDELSAALDLNRPFDDVPDC